MTPRYLRQPDAAAYLGVSVTHFTRHVRRELREVKIGGVLTYDLLDLDAWADDHTARYGRPSLRRVPKCLESDLASSNQAQPTELTSGPPGGAYASIRAQVIGAKPKPSSRHA